MEYSVTDSTSTKSSDNFVLEIVGVLSDSSDVPVTSDDLLVSGNEIPDEEENGHDWSGGKISLAIGEVDETRGKRLTDVLSD